MVATSPVRHESPQGMLSLDVQRYQPPWPTLNEYALHADLNQNNGPAIQHLINQVRQLITLSIQKCFKRSINVETFQNCNEFVKFENNNVLNSIDAWL